MMNESVAGPRNFAAELRKEHTSIYDSSMSAHPRPYYCRRCGAYVGPMHVEDMSTPPGATDGE